MASASTWALAWALDQFATIGVHCGQCVVVLHRPGKLTLCSPSRLYQNGSNTSTQLQCRVEAHCDALC